jgi:RNA recognition motif-containing protein
MVKLDCLTTNLEKIFMSIRLYIGNLPKSDVERQDLQAVFAEAGESVSAKVIKDRKTGKCRGFGFLTVEDESQADEIIEKYNGAVFQELAIKLEKALPKSEEEESGVSSAKPVTANRSEGQRSEGQRSGGGDRAKKSGGSRGGNKSGGGNKVPATYTGGDTSFQPDPRWANQLAILKERFTEVSNP